MPDLLDVAVLGATGTVGEHLVRLLDGHPWFRVAEVGASDRSAGDRLADRLGSEAGSALTKSVGDLRLRPLDGRWSSPVVLSALPSGVARDLEPSLAAAGHFVVSNASSHRMAEDVPLVVPEVNPGHLALLRAQAGRWPGGLVTNPNCVVAGVALALAPLHAELELEAVVLTTFQAISGAGRPGPAAADLVDNVLPHIPGEEEKVGPELRKILGVVRKERLEPATFRVGATTTRVPVLHGHLASVSMAFRSEASPEAVRDVLRSFTSPVEEDGLPLAPARPLVVTDELDRPQPRRDRDAGGGMAVTVGRIRRCEAQHVAMLVLSHNLVRGAAGAALLNAELGRARGWLDDVEVGGGGARVAGAVP